MFSKEKSISKKNPFSKKNLFRKTSPMKPIFTLLLVLIKCSTAQAQAPDDFQTAKKLLLQWNAAISEGQPEKLAQIYAPSIKFYLQNMAAAACVKSKKDWLAKHPTYRQEVKGIYLYNMAVEGVAETDIIAEFKKVCIENGTSKEYDALLVFRKINKEWKLVQETDLITEVNLHKKAPAFDLPRGKYHFAREYWEDVPDEENLAHDMVAYSYDLEIEITEESIRGSYQTYSGRMRNLTNYALLSGSMGEGILTIDVAMELDEDGNLAEETEVMHFKVINARQIVLLDKEMSWLYGKVMNRIP